MAGKNKPGNKPNNKSSAAVFEQRVFIVQEMLLSGLNRRNIIENISKNELLNWNVSSKQIDHYIKAANTLINTQLEKDRPAMKAKIYARYDFLYKKLINVKDYKGAGKIIEQLAVLMGANEAANLKLSGDAENPLSVIKKVFFK